MIKRFFEKLFSRKKETRARDFEWERFQHVAREQFKKLRDKGLSIPVVTI